MSTKQIKPHTQLQKLNYKYAAQRRSICGAFAMTTHILNQWGYEHTEAALKNIKTAILVTLKAQYESDKKFILSRSAKILPDSP